MSFANWQRVFAFSFISHRCVGVVNKGLLLRPRSFDP